ncbi:hypothetical protein BE20_22130 [Sorangium cellulosum]|nr:hypothetical protein BE20_22130 [Sorangium cellulosum]
MLEGFWQRARHGGPGGGGALPLGGCGVGLAGELGGVGERQADVGDEVGLGCPLGEAEGALEELPGRGEVLTQVGPTGGGLTQVGPTDDPGWADRG